MNIIAHWSMNDPTDLTRFWDNSGNRHHGSFGDVKPEVVTDSPNGMRAMKWTNAVVTIPTNLNPTAISFYVKKLSGCTVDFPYVIDNNWNSVIVSGGKVYVNAEEKGSQTVSAVAALIEGALNGGNGFILSDLYYYGSELTSTEIKRIVDVKASISRDKGLLCKEFVEEADSAVKIFKTGVMKVGEFVTGQDKTSFKKTQISTIDIEEI